MHSIIQPCLTSINLNRCLSQIYGCVQVCQSLICVILSVLYILLFPNKPRPFIQKVKINLWSDSFSNGIFNLSFNCLSLQYIMKSTLVSWLLNNTYNYIPGNLMPLSQMKLFHIIVITFPLSCNGEIIKWIFFSYSFKNSNAEITHAFLVSSDPLVTHEPNQGDTTQGFNPLSEFLETINSSSQKDSDLIS